jgi:glycosyltransferase involved in cell wall biosynthesis
MNEVDEIKQLFGAGARIIVRQNDTALPRAAEVSHDVAPVSHLRAVSLSRLSPKKGVETLLEGLRSVTLPVSLDIVGPAEDPDYYERCRRIAEQMPSNVQVRFLGAKSHEEVRETLAAYDLMACPTKGENFGHVIAEALSVGCPVMCADVTPWTARLASGGGVVVDENSAAGWARAITDYARFSSEERLERRLAAASAYDKWKAESSEPHFFTLLMKETMKGQDAGRFLPHQKN